MGQNHSPSESSLANVRETYSKSVIYRCHVKVKDGKFWPCTNQGKKAHYLHDCYQLGRRPHDLKAVEDRLGHDREGGWEPIPEAIVKHYSPQSKDGWRQTWPRSWSVCLNPTIWAVDKCSKSDTWSNERTRSLTTWHV